MTFRSGILLAFLFALVLAPVLAQEVAPVNLTDASVSRRRDNRFLDGRFTLHNEGSGAVRGLEVTVQFLDGNGHPIELQDLNGSMVAMTARVNNLPPVLGPGGSQPCDWFCTYLGTVSVIETRYEVKGTVEGKPFRLLTEPVRHDIPLWPEPLRTDP